MNKRWRFPVLLAALMLVLLSAACSDDKGQKDQSEDSAGHTKMDHSQMDMGDESGEVPENLQKEKNPAYKPGEKIIIHSEHMKGMDKAEGVVDNAYHTTAYSVTYTTKSGKQVQDHKWVIHEELQDAGDQPYKPGDKVVIEADHMDGMQGADAVIETAEETTVYMVDYTPADGGEKVTNHKWLIESELSTAE